MAVKKPRKEVRGSGGSGGDHRHTGKEGRIMKTMIYLPRETHTELRHISIDEHVSMAELIRRAVDTYLRERRKGGGGR
jgi:hypothetical protein